MKAYIIREEDTRVIFYPKDSHLDWTPLVDVPDEMAKEYRNAERRFRQIRDAVLELHSKAEEEFEQNRRQEKVKASA